MWGFSLKRSERSACCQIDTASELFVPNGQRLISRLKPNFDEAVIRIGDVGLESVEGSKSDDCRGAKPMEQKRLVLSEDRDIPVDKIIALYTANGSSAAKKPQELWNALHNSHSLVSAWIGEELVGLGNALSDGFLVVYYPHLLVLPSYQGHGIGGKILEHLKRKYQGFHQHILVADGRAIEFYKKHGFETAGKIQSMWIYEGADH